MIYEEYEHRWKRLPYPDRKLLDKEAFKAARNDYKIEEKTVHEALHAGLAKEYGLLGNPKEQKVWELAWSEGHSSGYYSIEQYYDQFSELVRD
jgi:hypothetical protein